MFAEQKTITPRNPLAFPAAAASNCRLAKGLLTITLLRLCLGSALAAQGASAESPTTADKVYTTQVNGRPFAMLIPRGISTVRGIIFYRPGVNGDSRSALNDVG